MKVGSAGSARVVVAVLALAASVLVPAGARTAGTQTAGAQPAGAHVGGAQPAGAQIRGAQGPAATAADGLSWGKCPEDIYVTDPRLECSRLRVPLDYRVPRGRSIEIAISRLPIAKPGLRRGVILLNPGGPGSPFLGMPAYWAALLPPSVRDRFDLIGFDPRFAGHSTPTLTCGLRISRVEQGLPWVLPGGTAENARIAQDTAAHCIRNAGDLLPHVTAANNARDMNEIRKALGEKKISYLGFGGGGTYFGAVFAQLFPQYSDRIVLDGAIDPNRQGWYFYRSWGPSAELRMGDFTAWAAAHDAEYHLGATSEQVRARYFELVAQLQRQPISLPPGTLGMFDPVLTGNALREATLVGLGFDSLFPILASAWQAAGSGDRDTLTRVMPGLRSALVFNENFLVMAFAFNCNTRPWPRDLGTYARQTERDRERYPVMGGMSGNVFPCAYWPAPAEPPVRIGGRGPANVLVLQKLRDLFAPYEGGVAMRHAFGRRARLVSVDGGGHVAYVISGNTCADLTTTAFLVTGVLPSRDISCPYEPPAAGAGGGGPAAAGARSLPQLAHAVPFR